jgi:hypothetical protein
MIDLHLNSLGSERMMVGRSRQHHLSGDPGSAGPISDGEPSFHPASTSAPLLRPCRSFPEQTRVLDSHAQVLFFETCRDSLLTRGARRGASESTSKAPDLHGFFWTVTLKLEVCSGGASLHIASHSQIKEFDICSNCCGILSTNALG